MKSVQKEMLEVQNRNGQIIEEHFQVFQDNNHVLQDCDSLLFSRQQINSNYDTICSLLAITFASLKSYRGAIYSCRNNMITQCNRFRTITCECRLFLDNRSQPF